MLLKRNILLKGAALLLFLQGAVSCSRDNFDDPEGNSGNKTELHDQLPIVTLKISPVTKVTRNNQDVEEKISSLRVIMLDGDKIEFNKFVSFLPEDQQHHDIIPEDGGSIYGNSANDFEYRYVFPTKVGKKSFFLVGNEQSVKKVKFKFPDSFDLSGSDFTGLKTLYELSEKEEGLTLSEALSYFTLNEANFTDKKGEVSMMMNSLYFTPELRINEQKCIYLPYTAFYDGYEITPQRNNEKNTIPITMYLVPCATKFKFKFINYRTSEPVAVDYLKLESIQQSNYLMANLKPSELKKYFYDDNKQYYWIDWLRMVAQGSLDKEPQSDNIEYNNMYGWIREYNMPKSPSDEDTMHYWFVEDGPADDPARDATKKSSSWILPEASSKEDEQEEPEPVITEFGPFYLPECKNMVPETIDNVLEDGTITKVETGNKVEKYSLKIKFRNYKTAPVGSTDFDKVKTMDTEISNLKSLFRSTSVLITITLRGGGVRIYATHEDWIPSTTFGYVMDENDI